MKRAMSAMKAVIADKKLLMLLIVFGSFCYVIIKTDLEHDRAEHGISIGTVVELLTDMGSEVVRHDRQAGDPWLDVNTKGKTWRVYFVACVKEKCPEMTLESRFLAAPTDRELLRVGVNNWNATGRFSRAFSDSDFTISVASDIAIEGVSSQHLKDALVGWTNTLDMFSTVFRKEIGR